MDLEYSEQQIRQIARQVIKEISSKTLCFYAPMGAGKTTLIKALLSELGAADTGSSPTFGIVNEYHDKEGELLAYHFDFYRLNDETEALDLGFLDYLDQNAWVFIEWPEKITSLLTDDASKITLEVIDATTRRIIY